MYAQMRVYVKVVLIMLKFFLNICRSTDDKNLNRVFSPKSIHRCSYLIGVDTRIFNKRLVDFE